MSLLGHSVLKHRAHLSAHRCTCHGVNQRLVRQKAVSQAAVAGHLCSSSRSDHTDRAPGNSHPRADSGPSGSCSCGNEQSETHSQPRFHGIIRLRGDQEEKALEKSVAQYFLPGSIHWLLWEPLLPAFYSSSLVFFDSWHP